MLPWTVVIHAALCSGAAGSREGQSGQAAAAGPARPCCKGATGDLCTCTSAGSCRSIAAAARRPAPISSARHGRELPRPAPLPSLPPSLYCAELRRGAWSRTAPCPHPNPFPLPAMQKWPGSSRSYAGRVAPSLHVLRAELCPQLPRGLCLPWPTCSPWQSCAVGSAGGRGGEAAPRHEHTRAAPPLQYAHGPLPGAALWPQTSPGAAWPSLPPPCAKHRAPLLVACSPLAELGKGDGAGAPGCSVHPMQAMSPPLYQTATFGQPSATEGGPYDYTRSGNPTRALFEAQVAALEVPPPPPLRLFPPFRMRIRTWLHNHCSSLPAPGAGAMGFG